MNLFRSPWLAGVNVIFGVMAGLFAAVFQQDLLDSTPLLWLFEGFDVPRSRLHLNVHASWFWFFLLSFAVIWVIREAVAAQDRKKEVQRLEYLIETVPPPNFLSEFEMAFKNAVDNLRSTRRSGSELKAVRLTLGYIIVLAAQWDYRTAGSADRYRANVMVNLGTPIWGRELAAAGQRVYGKAQWDSFESQTLGVLWVDWRLATAQPEKGKEKEIGAVDSAVTPLALVYDDVAGGKDVNLQGAPCAIAHSRLSYIADAGKMTAHFPKDLTANCKTAVTEYYGEDAKARSVISLPIPCRSGIIGTVNIYRNSVGIMGDESGAARFAPFVEPFLYVLGEYLEGIDIATLPSSAGEAERKRGK